MHLSQGLADFLLEAAPEVNREVEEELAPKRLKQRGIDPATV